MLPPGVKITTEILWQGAILFAGTDLILIPLLAWRIKPATFLRLKWPLVATTAIFWFTLWAYVLSTFWEPVYRFVFTTWERWFIPPVYAVLYACACLLFWWAAVRLEGKAVVNFCLLGGLWGMATHRLAIQRGIVDKPPVLQGASPAAAIMVAIFEFTFYWCIILSIAAILYHVWVERREEKIL